jgi:hypothetical protein
LEHSQTGRNPGTALFARYGIGRVDVPAITRMLGTPKLYEIAYEDSYKATGGQTQIGNKGEVLRQLRKDRGAQLPGRQRRRAGRAGYKDHGPVPLARTGRFYRIRVRSAWKQPGERPRSWTAGSWSRRSSKDVKLLGGISLGSIINNVADFGHAFSAGENIPTLKSVVEKVNGVDTLRTSYVWSTSGNGLRNWRAVPATRQRIHHQVDHVETPLNGTPPTFRLEGKLTDFTDQPAPGLELVALHFRSLTFIAVKDQKPDVNVDLNKFEFKGILAFVNRLLEVIPLDGFSDPPDLAVTAEGIKLGYSARHTDGRRWHLQHAEHQPVSRGVPALLTGKELNFHFAFCERQQPFILTVSLFGGGGFFGIDIGIDGVRMVEAALEFGASAAINLGVASGLPPCMGGFYFQKAGAGFELTGYFRASGSLSVLGIISVSLEFYLALTYTSKGGQAARMPAPCGARPA